MQFTSRKFVLAMVVVASSTWLVATGHVSDGVYSTVIVACLGSYMAANVAQKATSKEQA